MATQSWPFRVTGPLLDVVEVLLAAPRDGLHGWQIMKQTQRTGPTVYQQLERLAKAGWVERRWESANTDPNKPRRRFYWIKGDSVQAARALLAERRPQPRWQPVTKLAGLVDLSWLKARTYGGSR